MKRLRLFAFIMSFMLFCISGIPSQSLAQWQDRSDELPGDSNATTTLLLVGGIALATTGIVWHFVRKNKNKQKEEIKEKGNDEREGAKKSTSLNLEYFNQGAERPSDDGPFKLRVGIHPVTLKPSLGLSIKIK